MSVGLLLKTALFPLHFWLPPAHANALAPVSAILSALVVKGSFYMLFRFWFEVFPSTIPIPALNFMGALVVAYDYEWAFAGDVFPSEQAEAKEYLARESQERGDNLIPNGL